MTDKHFCFPLTSLQKELTRCQCGGLGGVCPTQAKFSPSHILALSE